MGPEYVIYKFPAEAEKEAVTDSSTISTTSGFDGGQLMAKVRCRWMLEPGYMHSFAVTENYFILIEQPMTVHAPTLAKGKYLLTPFNRICIEIGFQKVSEGKIHVTFCCFA